MTLNHLEYFCMVCRCKSITRAAEKLYISQPAISNAIRELEREFKVNLFIHAKNRLELTEDGQLFHERAEHLLRQVDTSISQLRDIGAGKPPVRVGVPPMLGSMLFPGFLRDFRAANPDIPLTFYEYGSARAADLVQAEDLEIGIVNMRFGELDKFNSMLLGVDHFELVVAKDHPLAGKKCVSLQEIGDVPLIMYNTDSVQNKTLSTAFEDAGYAPNVFLYSSQISTIKILIEEMGCGSFFYGSMLAAHPELASVPLEPPIEQEIGVIWRKGKYTSSSTRAFLAFIKEYPLFF